VKEGGYSARPSRQNQHDYAQLGWVHSEIDELDGSDTWPVQLTT